MASFLASLLTIALWVGTRPPLISLITSRHHHEGLAAACASGCHSGPGGAWQGLAQILGPTTPWLLQHAVPPTKPVPFALSSGSQDTLPG